jgi:hypothetical protein
MSEAFITHQLQNETVVNWLQGKDGYKITVGRPKTDKIDWDLAVVEKTRTTVKAKRAEILDRSKFNAQQEFRQSNGDLTEWEDGPFHYGNKIVMASWIAGTEGCEGITFLDVQPEDLITSDFERLRFSSVMKDLIEDFGFGLRYTHTESDLLSELAATEIDVTSQVDPDPVELPSADRLYDNEHGDSAIGRNRDIRIRPLDTSTRVSVANKVYKCVSFINEDKVMAQPEKFFIMEPGREEFFRRSIRNAINYHELYILSGDVRREIDGLKREFGLDNLTGGTRAFLSFAVGTRFNSIQTMGLVSEIDREERKLVEAVSKNQNIDHV